MSKPTRTLKRVKVLDNNNAIAEMFKRHKARGWCVMKDDIHSKPDLVVFTGGPDVNPKLYNEAALPESNFNIVRDRADIAHYNRYKNVPKVGICRGAQFLNVMNGGQMWQDVSNHTRDHNLINLLPLESTNRGDKIKVTSTHHQMMIPGPGSDVIGIAMNESETRGISHKYLSAVGREPPEFDTEVVWYEDTKSFCYQPHPEYQKNTSGEKYFFDLLDHFYNCEEDNV